MVFAFVFAIARYFECLFFIAQNIKVVCFHHVLELSTLKFVNGLCLLPQLANGLDFEASADIETYGQCRRPKMVIL